MDQQISHFKIREEIGSGGMGVVYRADDTRLKRKVALKVLPAGALADPTIRERLMREAQTASALNHPHIVTVYEIHSAGDRDFIAMELVPGRSLDRLIGDDGLPLTKALRYGIQIADGLASAHEHGVIHRDLKPQNIMITPGDDVKILDFGLAKRFLPPSEDNSSIRPAVMTLTAPGVKVGTPAYMSPEQIESRTVDARSDVFSFGCLLYEMLTGTSPFHRRNAILIFKAVLSEDPEPARDLRPELPSALLRILDRAMQKEPDKRYPSMGELLADLERVQYDLFGAAIHTTRSGVFAVPPQLRKSERGKVWPLLLAGALVVASLAVIFWILARATPDVSDDTPLTSSWGSEGQASLSPDGERLAFVPQNKGFGSRIWTRRLDGDDAEALTPSDQWATQPTWDASGESLLYAVPGDGIWAAPAGDAAAKRLLEVGSNPTVSRDGVRLVVEHDGRLWRAKADGTGLELMTWIAPSFFGRWVALSPAISPDGGSVAYFQPEIDDRGGLWVAPVDLGTPRRLLSQPFRGGQPVWSAAGDRIYFVADFSGELRLWSVDAAGGSLAAVSTGPGRHQDPTVDPAGRRLIYSWSYPTFALNLLSAANGQQESIFESRSEIVQPAVSPNGDHIAFSARVGGGEHLFTVPVTGGTPRQLTRGAGQRNTLPQWTRGGKALVFHQEAPRASLRRLSMDGGAATEGGESEELAADWPRTRYYDSVLGPNGQRVIYVPLDEGSPGRSRVRELATGREWELARMLLTPRWSRDGGLILGADGNDKIYLCPVSGSACRYLADGFAAEWMADGKTIRFAQRLDAAAEGLNQRLVIKVMGLADGDQEEMAQLIASRALVFSHGQLANGDLIWNRSLGGLPELRQLDLR